jgi:hypothetical protein
MTAAAEQKTEPEKILTAQLGPQTDVSWLIRLKSLTLAENNTRRNL